MQGSELVRGLVLAAVLTAVPAAPSAWAADDAAQAGKAKATQCFACHGADGMSKMPDAPNLAGQNEAYLVKALKDFRSGERKNEVMSMMAKPLSDADIAQLAAYYSGIAVTVKGP